MATTFEPVAERTRTFGRNGYFEIARRKFREGEQAAEFLVLSRGYLEKDGSKRWTKFVTIPDDADLKAWLAEALREV